MPDTFTPQKRSEVMSKIRASNTKPEILVRKYLHSKGFRFRIHQKSLPGRPDVVLKKYNAVILINGCFWHGHENCKVFKMPKSRQHYWLPKIEGNIKRDFLNLNALKKIGWRVFIIWECKLKKSKMEKTLQSLVEKILKVNPL
jgi:DNA mismatch endonuclease (patch repair protein)